MTTLQGRYQIRSNNRVRRIIRIEDRRRPIGSNHNVFYLPIRPGRVCLVGVNDCLLNFRLFIRLQILRVFNPDLGSWRRWRVNVRELLFAD